MRGGVQPRAGQMRGGSELLGVSCNAAFCPDMQYLLFPCDINDTCSLYGHPAQRLAGWLLRRVVNRLSILMCTY